MKLAINGLGRIGRIVFSRALKQGINVVAINDLTDTETLAYLLKYDSVHGINEKSIKSGKGYIQVSGKKIIVLSEKDPEKLPWKKLGIDVVIESTGIFKDREGASKHLKAGAKKVLISASGKDVDITIVMGVNEKNLKKSHKIISMASCTTNCIAPIVKILNNKFKVKKGFLTTIHAYTPDQELLDSPNKKFRRARAAAINLVPTTSGAASAVIDVIPSLKGNIDGMAIRAPVPCGSITDFVAILGKSVTPNEINNVIKKAAKKLKGILEYTEDELVSTDIIGNPNSSIFDSKLTKANGNMVKVLSWYDNEFGYSCRIVDLLKRL